MAGRLRTLGWLAANAAAGGITAVVYAVAVAPISRVRRLYRRRTGRLPDVLWGPAPIISNRYGTRAERLYGYRSDSLVYLVYRINQRDDFDVRLDRARRLPVIGWLVPYAAFLWAGVRYDHFCCLYDGGLLGGPGLPLELPLLRLAGKGIIVSPYGGDARVASATRARGPWNAYSDIPVGEEDADEEAVRRRLALFGRWADVMLGCADLVEDLPRLDGVLNLPFDAANWHPGPPEVDDGIVTVVHAPNHRHYKGTRFLEAAIEQLRSEGLPLEFVVVEGMTNDEAREVFARADIVADQFLLGAYGLFSLEAMALGKPVLCRLDDRFRPYHPAWAECPIVSADPDTVEDELRKLVLDSERRRELGARGPGYVEKYHSLAAVGAALDGFHRRIWER
jgi:glycosyltransferase involved in cell wall biosynthesis